jgi:hypothetical protein
VRQLSLFKSKRQRGVKPPPPREFGTHAALTDTLRICCSKQWRYTHIPLGELRDKATAARLKRMGVTPGWPDFLFAGPRGRVVWLELKRAGTMRFSEDQLALQPWLVASGHEYIAANSLKQAVESLQAMGVLPTRVEVQ